MSTKAVTIVRTWKRDGSTNLMPLEAAIENLRGTYGEQSLSIREALEMGRELQSKHARFRMLQTPDS